MSREGKRKLYHFDFAVRDEFNWPKAKRQKKSCFSYQHTSIENEDLDGMFETYSKTKRVIEGVSDDVLVCIVPGPLADDPENPNLSAVVKNFKKLTPKQQKPRIGRIDVVQQDAMRSCRFAHSFNASRGEDNLVFTTERKGNIAMNAFAYLPGDLWYNRWTVTGIAFAQLAKSTAAEASDIFAGQNPPTEHQDTDTMHDANADELALKDDEIIPFPHEHTYMLGKELINVFEVGSVVAFQIGSGEI